jgi:predicted ester cyclase
MTGTTGANKALIRDFMAAWGRRDVEATCAHVDASCNGGGAAGLREEMTAFLTAFPDLELTLEDILAEDDRVATRITMKGTHTGVLFGIPPTGRPVVMKANHIFRCDGGKIVQRHGQMDRLEVMKQIGMKVVPEV